MVWARRTRLDGRRTASPPYPSLDLPRRRLARLVLQLSFLLFHFSGSPVCFRSINPLPRLAELSCQFLPYLSHSSITISSGHLSIYLSPHRYLACAIVLNLFHCLFICSRDIMAARPFRTTPSKDCPNIDLTLASYRRLLICSLVSLVLILPSSFPSSHPPFDYQGSQQTPSAFSTSAFRSSLDPPMVFPRRPIPKIVINTPQQLRDQATPKWRKIVREARRPRYFGLYAAGLYLYDHEFQDDAYQRTIRTLWTG